MKFIDTNVFIRYLTGDDPVKAQDAYALFQRIKQGAEDVMATDAVLHETTYVLASRIYELSHAEIRDKLLPIIRLKGLKLPNKNICRAALDIFGENERLDFVDALAVAYVRNGACGGIYSYDRDFDRLEGSNRREP